MFENMNVCVETEVSFIPIKFVLYVINVSKFSFDASFISLLASLLQHAIHVEFYDTLILNKHVSSFYNTYCGCKIL